MSTDPSRPSASPAWLRAAFGAAVMALALGTASALSDFLPRAGLPEGAADLLAAAVCTAIAVPLVVLLRRRQGRSLRRMGLTSRRESARAFLLGIAVTAGCAVAVFGAATGLGWLTWGGVDRGKLVGFLVTNTVLALLLEAIPEETTLRGYAWSSLRERYRAAVATVGVTALFLVVPGAATVVHATLARVLGQPSVPMGLAPAGEDVASYLILLVVFSLTLIAARTALAHRSLWTAVGTHLTFLTVNRLTLFGDGRDAGWSAETSTPDAVLVVPLYLLLAIVVYRLLARRARRAAATADTPERWRSWGEGRPSEG